MTMASVTVTQGSPGNPSTMLTQKRYHLQSGTNSASPSPIPSPTPGKNYDTLGKGKKSWSVRLGLSRQSQMSEDDRRQGWGTISGGSALSRQMRYGDPWLYGTVRGQRSVYEPRNARGFVGPPHGAPVVIVCSCPEFLSGTARKLGTCKKCGRHRLVGLPIGGTCRVPSASSRARPSLAGVLKPAADDPYDLVRRSRLVEPRASRARSTSPHRQSSARDTRSQSVVRHGKEHLEPRSKSRTEWFDADTGFRGSDAIIDDDWLEDERENFRSVSRKALCEQNRSARNNQRDVDCRRSILECDVNPYLLVKKQLRDEDEFSDDLSDNALETDERALPTLFDSSKVKSIERIPARCSVAAIGGQRIRVFSEPREISEENGNDGDGGDDDDDNSSLLASRAGYGGLKATTNQLHKSAKGRVEEAATKMQSGETKVMKDDEDHEEDEAENEHGIRESAEICPNISTPIPKVIPKRPPRKQKPETRTVPVKSILKRLKLGKSGTRKKTVLFKVDDVIFAPAKMDFGVEKARPFVTGDPIANEDYEDYEETIVPEEKILSRPKFITIPNIKDPKVKEKSKPIPATPRVCKERIDKNVAPTGSQLPKMTMQMEAAMRDTIVKVTELPASSSPSRPNIPTSQQPDVANRKPDAKLNEKRTKDETEAKEEPEILRTPNTASSEQSEAATRTSSDANRKRLHRSHSERTAAKHGLSDAVPFNDTMRLSIRKRHQSTNTTMPPWETTNFTFDSSTTVEKSVATSHPVDSSVRSMAKDGPEESDAEEKVDERVEQDVSAFWDKEPELPPNLDSVLVRSHLKHFQKMRPTSWSPPPTQHKNLPQNRISDPGRIEFNAATSPVFTETRTSRDTNEHPKVELSSGKVENVCKITVSPLVESPLVHRLQIGSTPQTPRKGRKTSILINSDQSLTNPSSNNKVTISVGGEDSVCNPTVISVNSDASSRIQSSSENRTLVILDNYSSNIIVSPPKSESLLRMYSVESNDSDRTASSSTVYEPRCQFDARSSTSTNNTTSPVVPEQASIHRGTPVTHLDEKTRNDLPDKIHNDTRLSKEAIVSKLLEQSLEKAKKNGEILSDTSGEAILKILKQTLLKSRDYESSDSTIEAEPPYFASSSLSSELDMPSANLYTEENMYEVIKEPIYEEIPDEPPPLPSSPPPSENYLKEQIYFEEEYKEAYYKKFNTDQFSCSYGTDNFFEDSSGDKLKANIFPSNRSDEFPKQSLAEENYTSKFELLNYLMESKEQADLAEEEEEEDEEEDAEGELEALYEQKETSLDDLSSKSSQISNVSDSSEESNVALGTSSSPETLKTRTVDIERTDSGVGSESSQASSGRGAMRRWRGGKMVGSSLVPGSFLGGVQEITTEQTKLCQDCKQRLDPLVTVSGVVYAPFVCRKCAKKRSERKEIIMEIVETEQKYGRDLQIILEEFHRPMLRAGLLTQDQLAAIFLNVEELLEHNVILAEKLRDAVELCQESEDEDLVTMDVGKIFLESEGMLHAFESYCTRQGSASLLLQNLEKEKELLRIFLKVSQMENTVLRRMNLNSFLMVPVQRVTKYPLLLARLFKATPSGRLDIQAARNKLKQAQTNIELHLEHMNAEAKDVPSTKLWRRISIIQNGRRSMGEQDMVNIKLRKMAIEVLEWAHEEVRFVLEGRLLVAVPTDNNWRRGRTVKLVPVTAMLVTNGKSNSEFLDFSDDSLFPRQIGIKAATLLLLKEKIGRHSLLREPLYLDKCIVCCEADMEDYFEIQELSSKETFIFKAEDGVRTKRWCRTLQAHAQSLGAWRRRRGALANIMICGVARD